MPILPKHAVNAATFDKSTLTPMVGSGPLPAGRDQGARPHRLPAQPRLLAKDLPVKKGFDNYDQIRIEYYRDASTMFEAFKKGLYDVQPEGDPAAWNTSYNFPAVNDGRVVKEAFRSGSPKGMSGFVFNTRRPLFADIRVRDALAKVFDFEWVNKNLYYGAYVRGGSYFNDSELSALGRRRTSARRRCSRLFPGPSPTTS